MKILFASDYIDGTNTKAIYDVAVKRGIDCAYISSVKNIGNEHGADIGITNNGRWIKNRDISFKINTQHGQGFLGDSTPEQGIDICLVSCDAEKEVYVKNGYNPENVPAIGRPRIDAFFNEDLQKIKKDYLSSIGLNPDATTILYAPTYDRRMWGGGIKGFYARWCDINEEVRVSKEIAKYVKSSGINFIIRLHKYYSKNYNNLIPIHLYKIFKDVAFISSTHTHPNSIPVMISSDLLITDFSSIAFDYLALNRPIIFIEPNEQWKYTDKWFCPKENRAKMGMIVKESFDLFKFIISRNYWSKIIEPTRKIMTNKYVQFLDGTSSERALDYILRVYNEKISMG